MYSQFIKETPIKSIFGDVFKKWIAAKDFSDEEAALAYIVWCLEDTLDEDFDEYVRHVLSRLESYQAFSEREESSLLEETYHQLTFPHCSLLRSLLKKGTH